MTVILRARLEDLAPFQRRLARLAPAQNRQIFSRFLTRAALSVAKIAAEEKIIRGGKRGAPAHPSKLTSRTGTLRRSLAGARALDKSGLPRFIIVGSDLVYAGVHEGGGTFGQTARAHTRRITQAFGRRIDPVVATVGPFRRTLHFPARPFLGPALETSQQREWLRLMELSLRESGAID